MELVPVEGVANVEMPNNPHIEELSDLVKKILLDTATADNVQSSEILSKLCEELDTEK